MTFSSIPAYDATTPGNNTDIGGVSIAEGWPATNINNSIRQLLTQLKQYLANSVTIASASTVDLGAQTANYITISGTTTVTSFGTIAAGTWRLLEFSGAVPITYNATSMILPGNVSITAVAGDMALAVSKGSGNWKIMQFIRAAQAPAGTDNTVVQGRLTLTSGTAVTTGDVIAATTVYWTPYKGNQIAVYNGSAWELRTFAEMSIAVPATTATVYDVFFDYNSGTPQLVATAWTNDTTRATALTTQDGQLVKSGTLTQRYLGSFRTTAVSGQTEDSAANRFVWNYYNRIARSLLRHESSTSWTYSTATIRQANANTANKVSVLVGVNEDAVDATVFASVSSATSSGGATIGIGLDSTTTVSTTGGTGTFLASTTGTNGGVASFVALVGIGKHDLNWLEAGIGAGTQTWCASTNQGGIVGTILG